MPSVAILLATHNGAEWLEQQLDSVISQVGVEVYVFVSDDSSTDATKEIIASYQNTASEVYLLPSSDSFGSAASNFFRLIRDVSVEDYDYVAFCDQDDVWNNDKLLRAIECLTDSGSDAYSASVLAFWAGTNKSKKLSQNPCVTKFDFFLEGAGQGCTFVLTKSFFLEAQIFVRDNHLNLGGIHYHDWLIYAIARAGRKKWYFDDRVCMYYRQHSRNDTGAKGSLAGIFFRVKKILNGWYFNQILSISSIIDLKFDLTAEELNFVRNLRGRCFWRLFFSLIFNGRRRFSDRLGTFLIFVGEK